MGIDPFAPIPLEPAARTAEAIADLRRQVAALQRRQFDPAQWGLSGAAPFFTPAWRTIGDPGEPDFGAGFDAVGGIGASVSFWRNPWGEVHFRGQVINSGGAPASLMFILPAGYRPAWTIALPRAFASDAVVIDTNGEVSANTPVVPTDVVPLDGMRFYADV